jgi:hypothetical protein
VRGAPWWPGDRRRAVQVDVGAGEAGGGRGGAGEDGQQGEDAAGLRVVDAPGDPLDLVYVCRKPVG